MIESKEKLQHDEPISAVREEDLLLDTNHVPEITTNNEPRTTGCGESCRNQSIQDFLVHYFSSKLFFSHIALQIYIIKI